MFKKAECGYRSSTRLGKRRSWRFWDRATFWRGMLAGQAIRIATATAITPSTVLVIDKTEMTRVLHYEHEFSDRFISFMLTRNIRIEET